MKKVILSVLGVFALVIAALVFAASKQPETYHVERSVLTSAAAPDVYPLLADFHRFGEWSPWEELDPSMKKTFEGPASGVGSVYKWEGNDQIGAGVMKITDAAIDERVVVDLEFLKPFPSKSLATWMLKNDGGQTKITWAMDGNNDSLVAKAFTLFVDMDEMLGKDFTKGLNKLKAAAEADVKKRAGAAPAP